MNESNFVVPLQNFRIDRTNGLVLEVQMPSKKEATELAQSLNISTVPGSLLWGAGGGTYLLDGKYALMVKRSLEAPTNPGRWTFATGLGSSYEELSDPRLFIRELFEEIVLVTQEGELVVPRMQGDEAYLNPLIELWILSASKNAGIAFSSKHYCPGMLLSRIGQDQITIIREDCRLTTRALLHLDEVRGRVNLLSVVQLSGIGSISDLTPFDTELGANLRPLRRQTAWCDLETGKLLFPEHDAWLPLENNITPHAYHLLQALRGLMTEAL